MKSISIAAVQIRNFRSFVEEMIIFPEDPGLNFLGGVNELEPRLEANGAGKTSLWDAIVWCLYGRSIGGTRTSQILRWGAEHVSVSVTVAVDGSLFECARSGPPDRIFLEDKAATQEQVDELLGLTRERFLNSIIFGQGQLLFPDLSVSERGQLFDDILGLELWNHCSDIAKQRVINAQALIQGHKLQLANIEGQLEALPSEAELQKKINDWTYQTDLIIADKVAQAEQLELHLDEATARMNTAKGATPVEEEKLKRFMIDIETLRRDQTVHVRRESTDAATLSQLRKDRAQIEQGKCAACGQKLPNAATALVSADHKISILEANVFNAREMSEAAEKRYKELQKSSEHFRDDVVTRHLEKAQLEQVVNTLNIDMARMLKEIETFEQQINPYQEQFADVYEQRGILLMAQSEYQDVVRMVDCEIVALEYWKSAFKQIRLFYIGEVLSSLAIEVNAAIDSLGLVGWLVQFVTETENKSGTMKLGVQIEIRDPRGRKGKYEDFGSGGEDQRLRLGIGLGMASLIQRAAGVVWDIEILDEPTQFLSAQGVEDLLTALAYRAESQAKQIWCIDHRALTHSSFKEHWTVTKTSEGSKVDFAGRT